MEQDNLREIISKHSLFTPTISELIKSLLIAEEIKFHVVEHRTKDLHSLEQKLSRKQISNTKNITDISGIRIILYYQDDIDKVDSLLKKNFKIDEVNSIDKAEILESNEFGYLSVHYIIQLDNKRNKLPEWKNYSILKAEVQVRTVLQHSWASISHELNYKRNIEIPKGLGRKLFRLAGLFELADEQFMTIRDEHFQLKEKIEKLSKNNELVDEEINTLTLKEAISKENSIFRRIGELAYEAGFSKGDDSDSESIPNIILLSNLLKLESIGDIEIILQSNIDKIQKLFIELMQNSGTWDGDIKWFVEIALLLIIDTKQKDIYWSKNPNYWDQDIKDEVNRAITKVKKL